MTILHRVLRLLGIDRAVGYTLVTNAWNLVVRPVQVAVMVTTFTPDEQGVYFTFQSILAVQVFFELGSGTVLQQMAGHEFAGLAWSRGGTLEGDPVAKSRLASLFRTMVRAYVLIGGLMAFIVVPVGWVFFARTDGLEGVSWQPAWVWYATAAAVGMVISVVTLFLSGCGLIAAVARVGTFQTMVATISFFVAAPAVGLLAGPVGATLGLLVPVWWLCGPCGPALADLWAHARAGTPIRWRQEIWPFQWRIAVSWLSGFFIFSLYNPFALFCHGPAAAGRLGLTMGLVSGIQGIALAWVYTKVPTFCGLIAHRRYYDLDRLFVAVLVRAVIVLVAGSAVLVTGSAVVYGGGWVLAGRMLPPWPTAILAMTAIVQLVVSAEALYLRSHKREPFLWNSIAGGVVIPVALALTAEYPDPAVMLLAVLAVSVPLGLVWGTYVFLSCRRAWHAGGGDDTNYSDPNVRPSRAVDEYGRPVNATNDGRM